MNKFFAKLAGALSLVALVAGAGVAVAGGVNAKDAKAAAPYDFTGDTITFANQGLNNSVQYTNPFTSEVFSVQFGGGTNDGKYYTTGTGMRTYGGGYFTITAASGTISQIDFTWSGTYKPTASDVADSGSFKDPFTTWTGNAESVKFTRPSGSGHWRLQTIKVTLGSEGEEYSVSGTITNGSLDKSKVAENTELNVKIVPNTGYDVPASVTSVTMGGSTAAYTYDATTGNVNITSVTGDVVINATCPSLPQPEHAGTESDPYTVEDVIRLINLDKSATHSGVYVAGIVSQVDEYKEAYHSITYWISDDGTTAKQFECYSGKGINSADFSAITDVEVGASVVVCGTAKYYGTTYEFDKNNYLVSYDVTKTLDSITLSGDYPTEFEVGGTFSYEGLVVTAHYDDSSSKVVTPTSVSTPDMSSTGNKTVTVSYTEEETTKSETYQITVVEEIVYWTISFNPGSGSGTMDSVQVKDGSSYDLPACEFTAPQGEVFDAWEYIGTRMDHIESVDQNYEFTALWKEATEVTDTLTAELIGVSGTTYNSWTDKSVSSSAVYAGNSSSPTSGTTANSIQLRSSTSSSSSIHSGIVSTTSGGTLIKVEVVWNAGCTAGRVIDVYGKDTAYSSADDLYSSDTQGTKLGSITQGSTTELTGFDGCACVGVRSNNGALNIDSVTFTWEGSAPTPKVLSSISISKEKTEYEVGDSFVMPTVTAHYDDESTADVSSKATHSGFDSSTAVTGQEVTISYTESEVTKEASFFVNITEPAPVDTKTYKKVKTTLADYSGNYLIVYDEGSVAFDGSLETLDAVGNNQAVTIENEKIELSSEYKFSISKTTEAYSLRAAQGKYIGQTSDSNGLASSDSALDNAITFNGTSTDVVSSGAHLRFNSASNQNRFRYYKSSSYTSQKAIDLYIEVADAGEALMLDLLNTTREACAAEGEHSKADFEAAWSNLKTAYNAISDETVLNKLATTDGNAKGTMFYEALARYDLLVGKYGLDNFISGRVVSSLGNTSVISNGSVDNNSAMIIITVIALTSISSIAVLLVIKRRKAIR